MWRDESKWRPKKDLSWNPVKTKLPTKIIPKVYDVKNIELRLLYLNYY